MATTLLEYQTRLLWNGQPYRARACGRPLGTNTWEGWLEFVPEGGGDVIPSARETTQPNLTDLEYWATGLTPVYLEGAFERSVTRVVRSAPPPSSRPPTRGRRRPAPPSTSPTSSGPCSIRSRSTGRARTSCGSSSAR